SLAAAEIEEARAVADDQVEAVVLGRARGKIREEARRRLVAQQEFGDERAARARGRALVGRIAEIGDRREASAARDAHPRAAGLKVAPGEELGALGPPVRRLRRALAPLIAVGRDDEGHVAARGPREGGEA